MLCALVTGGSRGIGYGICEVLLAHGLQVAFTGRDEELIKQASESLGGLARGGHVMGVVCDSGDHIQVRETVKRVATTYGQLDILVNNAGVRKYGSIFDLSIEDWLDSVGTNINGYFFFCKETLPYLLQSSNPWIFNIGSTAGRIPFGGGVAYNTTKAAINGFSDSVQMDVRNKGIRVCQIAPGNVYIRETECPPEEEWQMKPQDIGDLIALLIRLDKRAMPSLLEIRPTCIPEHPEEGIRALRFV